MSEPRTIATCCDIEPEVGPDLTTKKARRCRVCVPDNPSAPRTNPPKPRLLIGWKHQDDTPEGMRRGRIWAWTCHGGTKLQVYDENFNRSPYPGVERHCGPANFTMIRMFHPYWCPGGRIPRDMDPKDKEMCRNLYTEFKHKYYIERGLAAADTGPASQAIASNTEMDNLFIRAYTQGDRERSEGGLTDILGSQRSQSTFRTSSSRIASEDFESQLAIALSAHNADMAPSHRRRQTNPHHHRNRNESNIQLHRHMSNAAAIHSNRRKERVPREQVTGVEELLEDMIKEEEDVDMMPLDSITDENQVSQNSLTWRPPTVRKTSPARVERMNSLSDGRQNGASRRLGDSIKPKSVTRRHSERPATAEVNGVALGLGNRAYSETQKTATGNDEDQQRACDKEVKKDGDSKGNGSPANGGNQAQELPVWGTGVVVLGD